MFQVFTKNKTMKVFEGFHRYIKKNHRPIASSDQRINYLSGSLRNHALLTLAGISIDYDGLYL